MYCFYRYFLYYIHQLLQRQQLCYIIIVSEQEDNTTFNKGNNFVVVGIENVTPLDGYDTGSILAPLVFD